MNKYPYESTGVIRYDPSRFGMKKNTSWWCIATVDREITRYYRYWISKTYGLKVYEPSWNAHISIIRGEKPRDDLMHLWKKYDGVKVKYRYTNMVLPNTKGKFFAVTIDSPEMTAIRQEFGLKHDWNLHITVGRTYDELDAISLDMLYRYKN